MDGINIDWFSEPPIDYEFKRYKILSILQRMQGMLRHNAIWPVITEVEAQLDVLYRFKYEKEKLDESMQVIKDIDFVNFKLIYELPADKVSDQVQTMHRLAEEAILDFEDMYMEARQIWRSLEKLMALTWIPEQRVKLANGLMAIVDDQKMLHLYEFKKPSALGSDWRTFDLNLIHAEQYRPNLMLELHEQHIKNNPDLLFCRLDYSQPMPFEDAALPIAKSILYSRLRKDFAY